MTVSDEPSSDYINASYIDVSYVCLCTFYIKPF